MPPATVPCFLLVFLKHPEPGRVKTRLARDVGDARAAELYRGMAERTVAEARRVPESAPWIFFDPPEREAEVRAWLGEGMRFSPQRGAGLGERLAAAFDEAFAAGAGRAVALGTDCPALDTAMLWRAVHALDDADAVIGPAADGGYYLLGLKRPAPEAFRGIDWSTAKVFSQTCAALRAAGRSWTKLPVLEDVDKTTNG